MEKTLEQYDQVLNSCRALFVKKTLDYGTSWRIFRPSSLTDQLFIKAKRLRTIQELGQQKVADKPEDEFVGLVNYSLMALIQLQMPAETDLELAPERANALYDEHATKVRELMMAKNHDYGEAWRDMRVSSLTDLILAKLLRIKQIEDNDGRVSVSEGVEGNYADIVNYSIFALILVNYKL